MIRFFTLSITVFTTIIFSANSQSVRNISAEQQGNKVLITYDLEGTTPSAAYRIELYCSMDNFNDPLRLVSGNVGNGVTSGHKIIEWRAEDELGTFEKDIMFEVRGYLPENSTPAVQRLRFIQPTSVTKVKRKKSVPVQWTGGANDSKVNIELCRNNEVISTIGYSLPNTGQAIWSVSKSTLPGKIIISGSWM